MSAVPRVDAKDLLPSGPDPMKGAARGAKAGDKRRLSLVVCGHLGSGKSTAAGRLLFELGGISARDMETLRAEAERLGKPSCAFAYGLDRQKEERERGVTIACTTAEFRTDNWHYTIIDAPGRRDFIKNMITGASQADVALLMVPADGDFAGAIARGNHKAGRIQGQTRQHARLIKLLGVKQLVVGINKMDSDVAQYQQVRYEEIKTQIKNCLFETGWKTQFVEKCVPILPISGLVGDNLVRRSRSMPWWNGQDVQVGEKGTGVLKVTTLKEVLNDLVCMPERKDDACMRIPVRDAYKIKGVKLGKMGVGADLMGSVAVAVRSAPGSPPGTGPAAPLDPSTAASPTASLSISETQQRGSLAQCGSSSSSGTGEIDVVSCLEDESGSCYVTQCRYSFGAQELRSGYVACNASGVWLGAERGALTKAADLAHVRRLAVLDGELHVYLNRGYFSISPAACSALQLLKILVEARPVLAALSGRVPACGVVGGVDPSPAMDTEEVTGVQREGPWGLRRHAAAEAASTPGWLCLGRAPAESSPVRRPFPCAIALAPPERTTDSDVSVQCSVAALAAASTGPAPQPARAALDLDDLVAGEGMENL